MTQRKREKNVWLWGIVGGAIVSVGTLSVFIGIYNDWLAGGMILTSLLTIIFATAYWGGMWQGWVYEPTEAKFMKRLILFFFLLSIILTVGYVILNP